MKYLKKITSIFVCLTLSISLICTDAASYLKINIIEAVNLHCKNNNEFYCNPYAIIQFKYSTQIKTTNRIECTKNPEWESGFALDPEICHDIITIYLYQYLTARDQAFLDHNIDEERFERGEMSPGYLGRVELELEKMPFRTIDDWFMVETPVDNSRIMFPSCIHLRIEWTSTNCAEPTGKNVYQIYNINSLNIPEEFVPKNFIAMCKIDFAMVYKRKYSRLDKEESIKSTNELDLIDEQSRKATNCLLDPNQDYGFLHEISNLTSIEEALVYKIIKRTTGENIDYEEFTKSFSIQNHNNAIQSFKEFFEIECIKKLDLTIERINNILKNDAQKFPPNTTNPFLTLDESKMEYSIKLNKKMMENVYNDTLVQFYAIENVKNLDKMDEDSYIQTLNKMVQVMKEINSEKKIFDTLFYMKNKVMLTNEGRVDKLEEKFFRIYALYKWNGGKFEYDEIKREYMLRRKYFYCYEIVKVMPTNILFQFTGDICPDNYVCVDPNGIIIKSNSRDPRIVFKTDVEKNGINFFVNMYNNKLFENSNTIQLPKTTNLRFKSLDSKLNRNQIKKSIDEKESEKEESKNDDVMNFEELLKMEEGMNVKLNENDLLPESDEDSYMNNFDKLYVQRRYRIKQKKVIIINRVFKDIPLLGELLSIANLEILDKNINQTFINREVNLVKKYLLIYCADIPFVEKAAKLLVDLVLCNSDKNKIRYLFNEMLEGLCLGDDKSIKIFEEIIRTIIIDSLIKTSYFNFDELHAKVNLVKTLNRPFCFKTMTKIRFIEAMLMLDIVKERITYIIWNNDSNQKILLKIHETELSIPITLPNNKRLFAYLGPKRDYDNARDVNKNYLRELARIQQFDNKNNAINPASMRFKSIDTEFEKNFQNRNETTVSTDKDIITRLENIKKKFNGHLNLNDVEDLFDFDNNFMRNNTQNNDQDLFGEFKGFFENLKFKQKENSTEILDKKNINNNEISSNKLKFKSIDLSDFDSDEFADMSLNQYNNPEIYQRHDQPGSQILTTNRQPSNSEVMDKIMKDPETKKIIEDTKSKPGNSVHFPKEIHTTYEVNRRGTKQITVNQNNPTKKLILDKLMDKQSFDDMLNQDECNEVDDQTGLYNVLKNIQNRKCSCDFLCIEIGTIYGPFDNLKPKNVTIMTNHKENVQVIIKPVIIVNSTIEKVPPKPNNFSGGLFDDEDCDVLKMSSISGNTNIYQQNIRFKQLVDKNKKLMKIKRKFYRKVEYGNEILATEIFKQGLNVIIIARDKGFKKVYERTFNTNVDPVDSDAMSCVLRDAGYDKIIVITGIGKWMGAVTPRLIKEIKQIGGPDINRLISVDSEDNSMADHAFILIGRRGLCRYNGVYRVKNYDISKELKMFFPDISSDPNDCYFENLTFENEKNKHSENQFFHLVDLRLTLNIMNDNRFSYLAPTITSVSPTSSPLNGGTSINIRGMNFGTSTLAIKEVLVRGVVCKDTVILSPNLITCTTGSSSIMGPGNGNVQVKLMCGLSSPVNTCNMFQYTSEEVLVVEEPKLVFSPILAHPILPVRPVIPAVVPRVFPQPIPHLLRQPLIPHLQHPLPLFAFKEKEKINNKYDENGNPDLADITNSLNKKMYSEQDPNSNNVEKIDNLVTDNFKNMLAQADSNSFNKAKDGFRKRRFQKIVEQLK